MPSIPLFSVSPNFQSFKKTPDHGIVGIDVDRQPAIAIVWRVREHQGIGGAVKQFLALIVAHRDAHMFKGVLWNGEIHLTRHGIEVGHYE